MYVVVIINIYNHSDCGIVKRQEVSFPEKDGAQNNKMGCFSPH